MTCEKVEPELVAYHFGLLEGAARAEVEAHLVSCPECVRAFVETKRAIETAEEAPRASSSARARLRGAVAAELGLAPPAAAKRRWWERPVAFAVAASVVLFASATTHAITSGPATPPYALSEHR